MRVQKDSLVVLPAVAEILGVLHKLGTGQLPITKVNVYIVTCSFVTFRYSIVCGNTLVALKFSVPTWVLRYFIFELLL